MGNEKGTGMMASRGGRVYNCHTSLFSLQGLSCNFINNFL